MFCIYVPNEEDITNVLSHCKKVDEYTRSYAALRACYWFNILGNDIQLVVKYVNNDLKSKV